MIDIDIDIDSYNEILKILKLDLNIYLIHSVTITMEKPDFTK